MNKYLLGLMMLASSFHTNAVDLTLLLGYQLNSDFKISDISDQPDPTDPLMTKPGSTLKIDEGTAFGLALDFLLDNNPSQRIGAWVSYQQSSFGSEAGLDDDKMDITHVHFTAMSYFPKGKWEPFALLGIGAGHFAPKDSSMNTVTRFSAQIAGGANYKFTESILLRLEARYIPTFFGGSSTVFCDGGCTVSVKSSVYNQFQANVGLQFRF